MKTLIAALALVAALALPAWGFYCTTVTIQVGSSYRICSLCYDSNGNLVSVRCF